MKSAVSDPGLPVIRIGMYKCFSVCVNNDDLTVPYADMLMNVANFRISSAVILNKLSTPYRKLN